ncbi:MAG: M20/M25/M40 family metallo-hydrolase [Verrucomicrobia bacterium]|nr:M20/M25/M40 family metallo-hydrolase [Verrucomicrobiota bacterium]
MPLTESVKADYFDFLRFPTVSADPARDQAMRDCASWLEKKFVGMGLEAEIVATAGAPVVLAKWSKGESGKRRKVLIYGHYDVQPAEMGDGWTGDPFEPRHMLGVAEAIREGGAATDVIFVVEGEEEVGSDNLEGVLRARKDDLQCDVAIISDTNMAGPDRPTLTYGLRGIAALEVELTGPSHDLHSGVYGGAVVNPITVLTRLLAGLHNEKGRVAVPGFYKRVRKVASWERKAAKDLKISDAEVKRQAGSPALAGEPGFSAIERIGMRPTAEINGITGGYQGPGPKTVLPSKASAKLTFRLVPHQDPREIARLVEKDLKRRCPKTVKIKVTPQHGGFPYFCDPKRGFGPAATRALSQAWDGKRVHYLLEGGTIPIVSVIKKVLGVETLLVGLSLPDCRAHGPDETFPIGYLERGARMNRALLREIAGV